jgi:hypothetical protein
MAGRSLTPLGELLELATRKGIDEWGLAERLLAEVKAGAIAYGYRRLFTFADNGDRIERLPRDTHRQPIPNFMWQSFEGVSGALASKWLDDPEETEEWAEMDWVSGQLETSDLDMESYETVFVHFYNVAIESALAKRIVSELEGKPKKQRGAPKGPRRSWEKAQVQKGVELIRAGDVRPDTEIAASLVHRDAKGTEIGNQKRRILAGIRSVMSGAENSAPE